MTPPVIHRLVKILLKTNPCVVQTKLFEFAPNIEKIRALKFPEIAVNVREAMHDVYTGAEEPKSTVG